jgi:hypothetical protein
MNYMNVLGDFEIRLNNICPEPGSDSEIRNLQRKLDSQNELIKSQENEISKLRTKVKAMSSGKTGSRKSVATKKVTGKATSGAKSATKVAGKATSGTKSATKVTGKATSGAKSAKKVAGKATTGKGTDAKSRTGTNSTGKTSKKK